MDNSAFERQVLRGDEHKATQQAQDKVIEPPKIDLIYSIYDSPPWYLCILLGFQHYLTAFGATVAIPLLLAPAMGVTESVDVANILSTTFFVSGMVTILQCSLGIRLPIIQGGTFSFLAPAFAILALDKWKCEPVSVEQTNMNMTALNISSGPTETVELCEEDPDAWKLRMREIQGAIILASLFQVVLGATGLVGVMLQFIGPLVIAPTIALIGIALFPAAADFSATNWYIALMTMVFIILFSQYLRNINVPCIQYKKNGGITCSGYPVFKLFPIILAIALAWAVCAILTVTDALPDDPDKFGYLARTDINSDVLRQAQWFRFPYPCQWGLPTFSVAGVFGMLSGVIAGMVESVGDYYACARLSGAPPPPVHAINRGIFIEGIGCVMAGLWGTGTGTTSYSENVGAIGITKVGSTKVVFFGGLIMMIFGMLGKFGALFVTIPTPVIGGVFMVMFGIIAAVGVSNLQFVDMNSSRNLFIFGFSLFFGLSLPQWINANPDAINTGDDVLDQLITVLLSTSMFVGGFVAFVLDNTIPGTDAERGLHAWHQVEEDDDVTHKSERRCYDLPLCMNWIRAVGCFKYVPICPTFKPKCNTGCGGGDKDEETGDTGGSFTQNGTPQTDSRVRHRGEAQQQTTNI